MPERYEHSGNAAKTTLTNAVGTGDTSLIIASATGWPTGAVGKFWLVLDRGLATEEKVLALSRTGTTITVSARGADGTTAFAHAAGTTTVEHIFAATEADDASAHIMATTDRHGIGAASAVVGTQTAQTLINKTIDGASNTLTIPQSQVTNLVTDQATQNTRLDALEAGSSGGPTGAITAYAASAAPTGWLLCDGAAVSRSTFAALFAVIGTTYGAGDGSTTFNVPNLKGRVPVGLDAGQTEFDALAETGGAKTHTLVTAEMPSHAHDVTMLNGSQPQTIETVFPGSSGTSNRHMVAVGAGDWDAPATGGGGAHNNLQPYLTLRYIIKT